MDFWNIALPALIFLAPALAFVYSLLRGRAKPGFEPKLGMLAFGSVMFVSLFGVFHFDDPVRLEFLWPFTSEPSGYFEFLLQAHWSRFVWIFFSSAALFALAALEGVNAFRASRPDIQLNFLLGASLFSSLAYLSENVLLSLMFLELLIFLLYCFCISSGGKEAELERVSYFKRASFLFLAMLALLVVSLTGEFSTGSVILLGVVLYVMALVLSKHGFSSWNQPPLALLQAATVFFLLGRVIREDMAPELWLPISAVFGVMTAVFSWLFLLSASAVSSSFWLLFSMVGYLLFLRFNSGHPEDPFWGAFEVVALSSAFAIGSLYRYAFLADHPWKKTASFFLSALFLGIVSGAIPGIEIAGARATMETPIKLVAMGALTFLIALVVGKSLRVALNERPGSGAGEGRGFLLGLAPSLALLVVQIGAVFRITEIYGEGPFRMGAAYLLTNPHVATMGSSVILGLLAGMLIGSNSSFVKWSAQRERRMEDLFPSIDPAVVAWNEKGLRAPEKGVHWITERSSGLAERLASGIQRADRTIFGEKLFQGIREYSGTLSSMTRYFHSGSIRSYLFIGILITLLSSVLFLVEGR